MTTLEFEQFHKKARPHAVHLALSCGLDSDMAEDAAQEVFIKMWRNHKGIHPFGARKYMERTVRNWVIDRSLKAHRRYELRYGFMDGVPEEKTATMEADPSTMIEKKLISDPIKTVVDDMMPWYRSVMVSVDMEGNSYRDAGLSLGLSMGTVRSRLHRARQILKAALA